MTKAIDSLNVDTTNGFNAAITITTTTNPSLSVVDGTAAHGLIGLAATAFGPIVALKGDSGDANSKVNITATGMAIGAGGASATDVSVSRTGTSALQIDATSGVAVTGSITLSDAKNIVVNTTTGTKIGTATSQKLGFWNATPVIQQASASQAAVTATASTQTTPWGYSTQAQADAIVTLVNRLRLDLVTTGIIKGAA